MKKKLFALVTLFALIGALGVLLPVRKIRAQIATVVGQVVGANLLQPTTGTGIAGLVTNPASNFIINVAGGPVFFNGATTWIGTSALTLAANNTYLVVWNGAQESLYAKQAVTGPGSSGTTVGVPTSLLFAIPGLEIPLATVVCNGTACGNGGNGSITDNRPLAAFPAGVTMGGHVNQTVAGTAAALSFAGTCTLAGNTCTMTFPTAFQSAPACLATDQTTPQLVKAPATTASVIVTDTVGATDVVSVVCFGNPN